MTQDEPHHLHSLDVARGMAALAVVLYHWQHFFFVGLQLRADFNPAMQPGYALLRGFYNHGHAAVSLFFSLSGFIFFWLFASRIAAGSLGLTEFFVHRVSRLYPLHLATLLAVAAGQAIYHALHGAYFTYAWNDLHHFLLNLFLLSSIGRDTGLSFNGPSWSVSVEMTLYAVFFLYCSLSKPRFATMAVMALLGFLVLGRFRTTLGSSVGSFFLGGCMSSAYARLTRDPNRARVSLVATVLVAALWIAAFAVPWREVGLPAVVSPPGGAPDLLTVVLFPLTILALTLAESESPAAFRRLARATRLGPLSYSVYLIHFPLQLLIVLVTARLDVASAWFYSPVALAFFFALLIGIGLLSHYRFEMPIQRLMRARLGRQESR